MTNPPVTKRQGRYYYVRDDTKKKESMYSSDIIGLRGLQDDRFSLL